MRVNNKGFSKKQIITISAIVLVLLAVLITVLVYRSKIRATTMRLLRIEGTVTMEEDGRMKDIRENARLKSGNAIDTSVQSLASIGLDDYKVVTLDEVSRAEFNQSGKYLNLNLKKGSLFFEVDKALADDETFEIETSTMIVGIRGTSGWVSVAGENESLIITDGHVHVIGTNPVTGEVKEIEVNAGQRVTVYLYNDREVDSIMFELEEITEKDLPEFVLRMLREDPELLDRVINATGWDKEWILGEEVTDVTDITDDPATTPADSQQPSAAPSEEPAEPETTAVADLTDVDGNDNNPAPIESFAPVEKPEPTVLDVMKEEALKHVVSDNADGTYTLDDGTVFDPEYYAERYPDVAEVYGTDREALLAHYLLSGKDENRYVSQQDEDDKILQEAIARLPEDEPEPSTSASPTPTGPRYSTTTNAYLLCNGNDFTLADGSTRGSFDGTTFNILQSANTTVVLPKEIYWNDAEYTIDLTHVEINTATVDTVDTSLVGASIADMTTMAKNVDAARANMAGYLTVTDSNIFTTIDYGGTGGKTTADYYGYRAVIQIGQNGSLNAFKNAVTQMDAADLLAVNFGNADFDPVNHPGISGDFGVARIYDAATGSYRMDACIGTQEYTNININWNHVGNNGNTEPMITSGGTNTNNGYVTNRTLSDNGLSN